MPNSRHQHLCFAEPTSVDYNTDVFHIRAIFLHSLNCFTKNQQKIRIEGITRELRLIKELFCLQSDNALCKDQMTNQIVNSDGSLFTLNSLCECVNNCVNGRIPIVDILSQADNVYQSYPTDQLHEFVKLVQNNCSHLTLSCLKYHNFHQYDHFRFTKLGFQHNKGYMIIDVREDELAVHSLKNQSDWNSNLWECTTSCMQSIFYITTTDLGMLLRQVCCTNQ